MTAFWLPANKPIGRAHMRSNPMPPRPVISGRPPPFAEPGSRLKGSREDSRQGDVNFAQLLADMGCEIKREADGITVAGRHLRAAEIDMGDMPDMVPTLAVVAAFAEGTTVIKNVSHLKAKESDRLTSVVNELVKMGIQARCSDKRTDRHGRQAARG